MSSPVRRSMLVAIVVLLSASLSPAFASVKPIPTELIGKWIINKILPTQTISCWDDKQAQTLIGTSVVYKSDGFNWNKHPLTSQGVTTTIVEAQEFLEDNSGSGSIVEFKMLGIVKPAVERVIIKHADVEIKGITDQGTVGIPGDDVMIKDKNSLILSVCNVWFEAQRQN